MVNSGYLDYTFLDYMPKFIRSQNFYKNFKFEPLNGYMGES